MNSTLAPQLDQSTCGVTKTMRIIGSKWTMLILRDLFDGTKRFGELQSSLTGISPKTLSVRLEELQRDGIVAKKIYPQVPPKVEYSLTAKGESLHEIIDAMRYWGEHTN
jgi:DNA-binding HxlR family transcriptional regulator